MNDTSNFFQSILIILGIFCILGIERFTLLKLTKNEKWKGIFKKCPLLHPNGISVMRFPQGVIAIYLASIGLWPQAILWFAFWMITDLSDGTIARNCDLVTETGKWLDPLSDKLMHFPALLFMAFSPNIAIFANAEHQHHIFNGIVIAYCIIDTLGQFSRLFSKKIAANSFGKAKTALVTVLISIIAIHQVSPIPFAGARLVCVIMTFCLILAFLSLYCKVIPDNWYANSLTTMNLLCGLAAICTVIMGASKTNPDDINPYILAFLLVFLGQFFDLFDGRLARKFGSTSWGALYDDIADATSFGFAISALIFKTLAFLDNNINPITAGAIALIYLVSLIYRLYRFLHPTKHYQEGIFQGMPAPAGALLAGSACLLNLKFNFNGSSTLCAMLILLASFMMISNLPYRHFGRDFWPSLSRSVQLLLLILAVLFVSFTIVKYDRGVALIIFCTILSSVYTIFGIASKKYMQSISEKRRNN